MPNLSKFTAVTQLAKKKRIELSKPETKSNTDFENLRDSLERVQKECIAKQEEQKDRRKTKGKAVKRVRTSHAFTVRDVRRIAKKVVQDDSCKAVAVSAAVVKAANWESWVDLLISILETFRSIYRDMLELTELSDLKAMVVGLRVEVLELLRYQDYLFFEYLKKVYSNAVYWVAECLQSLIEVLEYPQIVVRQFQPIDDFFILALQFLRYFKAELESVF